MTGVRYWGLGIRNQGAQALSHPDEHLRQPQGRTRVSARILFFHEEDRVVAKALAMTILGALRHPVTTAPRNPPKGVGADQRVRPSFLLREGDHVVAHNPRNE